MQLLLPIYPSEATMISDCVGFYTKERIVQYIINGMPAYAHSVDDLNGFRFITSNLIKQGLCSRSDIQRSFHVSEDSVRRYYNKFEKDGPTAFYGIAARKGSKSHKIVGARVERIQKKLDKGQSVLSIAKEEGVAEGAIRYQINQGTLKKSQKYQ
jgi:hypothetical protein